MPVYHGKEFLKFGHGAAVIVFVRASTSVHIVTETFTSKLSDLII